MASAIMVNRIVILRKQGLYFNTGPRIKELVQYGVILQKIHSDAKYHTKWTILGTDKEYMIGNMYLAKKIELQQIKSLD